ncbi:hypothetical protein PQX77_007276 [Marasmius sp. AFHP31]|nr:hypothetical protein PQX77_007276 [Marasmius sp. AFHP31]
MFLAYLIIPVLLALPSFTAHRRHGHHHSEVFGGRSNVPKRGESSSGQLTYYDTGLGACGWQSKPEDFIVALATPQYEGKSHCGKTITISHDGKTAEATVVDECPTCNSGDLDASEALFKQFADTSTGVVHVEWWFN